MVTSRYALVLSALFSASAALAQTPSVPDEAFGGLCVAGALSPEIASGIRPAKVERVAPGPVLAASGTPNGTARESDTGIGAHCLVQGEFESRKGVDGTEFAIRFELRVPEDWNGRLLYQGGSGLNGSLSPAMGTNISNGSSAPVALARGFAVVSTDSGHEGPDAEFGKDEVAKINFAYGAIGKVTRVATGFVARLTGSEPSRTYFEGCSNGGREAMIAAQRHSELFDGIVAGNPAFHLSRSTVLANYSQKVYAGIAPGAADGKPRLAMSLTEGDLSLLSAGILAQCDELDGAEDGMVFDQKSCNFDPSVLQCHAGQGDECLSQEKVQAITAAFRGPLAADGTPVASSWVYDTGVSGDNWKAWQIGLAGSDGIDDTLLPGLISDTLARYFSYPQITLEALAAGNQRHPWQRRGTRGWHGVRRAQHHATGRNINRRHGCRRDLLLIHGLDWLARGRSARDGIRAGVRSRDHLQPRRRALQLRSLRQTERLAHAQSAIRWPEARPKSSPAKSLTTFHIAGRSMNCASSVIMAASLVRFSRSCGDSTASRTAGGFGSGVERDPSTRARDPEEGGDFFRQGGKSLRFHLIDAAKKELPSGICASSSGDHWRERRCRARLHPSLNVI